MNIRRTLLCQIDLNKWFTFMSCSARTINANKMALKNLPREKNVFIVNKIAAIMYSNMNK